ncbi:MAG: TonB-dependent receptor [Bacteroidales bacterium]|nr:TonB-dependent receptor [Bacteroidales bacterium]
MKIRYLFVLLALTANTLTGFSQNQDSISKYDLEEIVVSAFRTRSDFNDLPHSIQVLLKKDIESIPSENLSDLLKKTSGIDVIEYPGLQSNIGMRGYSPTAHGYTYTMVLVNGMPAGTQNIAALDLQMADQVEILKGPFSAFFGSGAMAGIINVVTPISKGKIKGSAGLTLGSYGTGQAKVQAGGSLGEKLNFDFYAKAMSQQNDYKTGKRNLLDMTELEKEIMDPLSYNQTAENTSYEKYNAGLRLGWDLNENWEIHLYEDMFMAKDVLMHGTFWGIYGQQQKDLQRLSHNLVLTGQSGNHSFRFSPYFISDEETYFSDLSDERYTTSVNHTNTYGFILQDEISLGKHSILFGIDNKSYKYKTMLWSDEETRTVPYFPNHNNMSTGTFFQFKMNLLDNKLKLSTGARYDYIRFKVYDTDYMESSQASDIHNTLNPNLGIQYSILPGLKIHASTGTAFLAPDAFKKTGTYVYTSSYGSSIYKGNPDLKPESSFSSDLGFGINKRELGLSADITLFANTHHDMIVYDYSSPDTITFKNSDNAQMNGLEGSFAFDFGVFSDYRYSLKLYASITHLLKSEVVIDSVVSDMNYVRRNNASFGVEFRNFKGFSARINCRYIGHRLEDNWLYAYDYSTWQKIPFTTTSGEPIREGLINEAILEHPDFIVIDLSCSYTFKNRYKFGLQVQNLADENYTEKDTYYMPGRMISGSFTYQF